MHVIVGLGITGLSCARYLARQNIPFAVNDTRQSPPHLNQFKNDFPGIPMSVGGLDEALFAKASALVISPGVSLKEPLIVKHQARGIPLIGDIELFARAAAAPVIAITGTNAKSTVTTLVGEMAKEAKIQVEVGGNLGLPALDLLEKNPALFVLELSSFQLETTDSLSPFVATVLNITPDHLDRHGTLEAYTYAKQKIYSHSEVAVSNRDDPLTKPSYPSKRQLSFALSRPGAKEFGLLQQNNETYLSFEDQRILPVNDLPIRGQHYIANALAALALGYGFGISMAAMKKTLLQFKGLPHRCQLVKEDEGIFWYNDSKGTNVGATIAAILGIGSAIPGKLILIAGGVGKNADFHPLVAPIMKFVKSVVLLGEAAPQIAEVLGERVPVAFVKSMEEAVQVAKKMTQKGDGVLLSPACASLDMFKNYEHRGEVFMEYVKEI